MAESDNFSSTHSARGVYADLILGNGRIYTQDPSRPWAEAVAIRDGKLIGVASLE